MARGRKRSNYYIDPDELYAEIKKFKESETDIMSEELGKMLIKLANKYASMPQFSGYSFKEDFIADAILRMVQQIHKIDLSHPKCNPFFYLSKTCYHVFISKITKEKKFTVMKEQLRDKYYDSFEVNENLNLKKPKDEKNK